MSPSDGHSWRRRRALQENEENINWDVSILPGLHVPMNMLHCLPILPLFTVNDAITTKKDNINGSHNKILWGVSLWQYVEVRGGSVMFDVGAIGGNFVGVFFIEQEVSYHAWPSIVAGGF